MLREKEWVKKKERVYRVLSTVEDQIAGGGDDDNNNNIIYAMFIPDRRRRRRRLLYGPSRGRRASNPAAITMTKGNRTKTGR